MLSNHIEQWLDSVATKVATESLNYDPDNFEYISDWVRGSMLDPSYDALEMFCFEVMAQGMRKMHGFDTPSEQD